MITAYNPDGLRPLHNPCFGNVGGHKRFLGTLRQGRHHHFVIVEARLPSPRVKATGGQARFRQKKGYVEVSIMMV